MATLTAPAERPLETGWLDDTPTTDNLLRQFLRNQADLGATIAVASGGRAAEVRGAIALADTGSDFTYGNQATLLRPLADLGDQALDVLDEFWASEGRAHMLLSAWPTPELSRRGWQLVGHPMLVVRGPGPHPPAQAPRVSLHDVNDADALAEAERVVIEGYPLPELAGHPAGSVLPPALLTTDNRYCIARVDGEAVAAAGRHVAHGVVNLCMAATLPVARRLGAWSSLVWARVDEAPELPAVAFTSDYSRPGFVKLGFLPVLRFTLWERATVS